MATEGTTKASFYTSFRQLCPGGATRLLGCSRPGFPRGRKEPVPPEHVDNAIKEFKSRGVDTVVCLLSDAEAYKFYNMSLVSYYEVNGLVAMSFPIIDHDVPTVLLMSQAVDAVVELLSKPGKRIAVHCSAGIGRTNLLGACLAAYFGPPWKFETPQTEEQCAFAEQFWKERLAANALSPNALKAASAGWKFRCQKHTPLVDRDWRTSQNL